MFTKFILNPYILLESSSSATSIGVYLNWLIKQLSLATMACVREVLVLRLGKLHYSGSIGPISICFTWADAVSCVRCNPRIKLQLFEHSIQVCIRLVSTGRAVV